MAKHLIRYVGLALCLCVWLTASLLAQGTSNEAATAEAAEPELHRGTAYSKAFQSTMKPIGRLITSLRLRLDSGGDKTTIQRMLVLQGARLNQTVVYAGVIDDFGAIKIASLPEHPDYGGKYILRKDGSWYAKKVAMEMRYAKSETWMTHRIGRPDHFEVLVQPGLKGDYEGNLIYYCIDLAEICRRAEREMPLRSNEAYYLISKQGHLICHSLDGSAEDSQLTSAETTYLNTIRDRFVTEFAGTHSHVGFARGSAELITQTFSWAKLAHSAKDDWILVFEEKTPTLRYEDHDLFGTWKSTEPSVPLSLGILQEGPKLFFRADGVAGVFRAEGRFVGTRIGVTSSFQDKSSSTRLVNFSATYDREADLIRASMVWERDGNTMTRRVALKRVSEAAQLAPLSVPVGFTSFPDLVPEAPSPASETE